MMKKKIRKINVFDKQFNWIINRINEQFVYLKIWDEKNKRIPWLKIKMECYDAWLSINDESIVNKVFTIKPKLVSELILLAKNKIGLSTEIKVTYEFEYFDNKLNKKND